MISSLLERSYRWRMIPEPRSSSFSDGVFALAGTPAVSLELPAGAADAGRSLAVDLFRRFWGLTPEVEIRPLTASMADEQSRTGVSSSGIAVSAGGVPGLRYALYSLRQLAEAEPGKAVLTHYELPFCVLDDAPALSFRAVHLCIFPETPMWQVEKQIRIAAYHKYNYAVVESWGVFPFRSHPEFGWAAEQKSRSEFQHLLDVAKECGITLFPQFNVFGHASMARSGTAKHAVLDFHPELEPLFEPNGWSFCLSNPETRKILRDLALELYEFYGCPKFFHLGCDEAYDFQTCRVCASSDPEKLLLDHLTFFRDLFAEKGTRVMMWHDMLLENGDPRWKDCIVVGDDRTKNLYRKLPKDIVICDWQYGQPPKSNADKEWPTSLFFRDQGFDVAVCPWMDSSGALCLADMAAKQHLFGLIETTWHTAYGGNMDIMYRYIPSFAWNAGRNMNCDWRMSVCLARHLRQVGYDMGITSYEQTGHTPLQIVREFSQK